MDITASVGINAFICRVIGLRSICVIVVKVKALERAEKICVEVVAAA